MKKAKFIFSLALPILLASCGGDPSTSSSKSSFEVEAKDKWSVKSKDESIVAEVSLTENGEIYYQIQKDGKNVVNSSRLGMLFQDLDLSQFLTFKNVKTNTVSFNYDSITGKRRHNEVSYNEMVLTFNEYYFNIDVTFRLFNDGYAFKYDVSKALEEAPNTLTWTDELTQFALPNKSKTYAMAYKPSGNNSGYYWYSYEDYFSYRRSDRLGSSSYSMPFLYQTDGIYSLITESELIGSGYHGSFLKPISDNSETIKTVYPNAHGKNPDYTVDVTNGFSSPWRVGIVGDEKTIVESNLVEDVYGDVDYYKPANYDSLSEEDKKTYDYSWVEPGLNAWSWLYYNGSIPQNDYSLQRKYIDLAKEMGWRWVLIDGGWQAGRSDAEIKDLTKYAHDRNIKVAAWGDAFNEFGTEYQMRTRMRKWKSLGIDGLKVDFWDGQNANIVPDGQMEDKQTIAQYDTFYKVTAEYQMIVNCHGANKPTGERRVYPHVINREAIRGNEFKSVSTQQTVFNTFIRSMIGPSDFTPVVKPFRSGITAAQQLALNIMYESGTPSMADKETRYTETNYKEFFQQLPCVWDEINYIEGNVEEYAVLARRNYDNWWIGAISCLDAKKEVTIKLDFLSDGAYEAKVYKDNGTTGASSTVDVDTYEVKKNDTVTINMDANGGAAIKLIKK